MFGESYNFKLPEGGTDLKTHTGSILTIILTLLMMFYTYNKIQILHYRKDTASIESEQIDVFNEQVFGTEDGLKFAAALTSYNNFKEDE